MSLIPQVIGAALGVFSIWMWYGHSQYVKRETPFQKATAYKMILTTFTSIGLLIGCRLWILPVAVILWFWMPYIVIEMLALSRKKILDTSVLLFIVVLLFAADFCWVRKLSLLGWIVSFIVTTILYVVSGHLAFPVKEKR